MSEEIERPDELDAAAATPQPPEPEPAPAPDQRLDPPQADIAEPGPDFDRSGWEALVKQYDDAIQAQQPADAAPDMSTEELLQGDADRARDELEDDQDNLPRTEFLEQQNAALLHAQREQKGWADFETIVVGDMPKQLPGFPVRQYMLGRLLENPGVMLLWDNREDPRARVRLDYILKQERMRMKDVAAEITRGGIDADATADREMVCQVLRSGRGEARMPEPPLQLGNLSDKEFNRLTEEKFGFVGMR